MRGVDFGRSQAPCAAAGEVRPDPFPFSSRVLCVELNGCGGVFWVTLCGELLNYFQWKGTIPDFGFSVGEVEQLASMGAHGALNSGLFG